MNDKAIHKTIIDENNYIVDRCVLYINGKLQYFKLKKNQKAVDFCPYFLVKGQLKDGKWVETATKEEIKEYYDKLIFL